MSFCGILTWFIVLGMIIIRNNEVLDFLWFYFLTAESAEATFALLR